MIMPLSLADHCWISFFKLPLSGPRFHESSRPDKEPYKSWIAACTGVKERPLQRLCSSYVTTKGFDGPGTKI